MKYNWLSKNTSPDLIYMNRLRLISELKFDFNKTPERYSYYMKSKLGIVLM